MRTKCVGCGVIYFGLPPSVCGCGNRFGIGADEHEQESFFTESELRGPGMKRWSVQWRWKPRVWKEMVTDECFTGMVRVGNGWRTHDVQRTLPTLTMARHAVDSLRRRFPGKSFRITQTR